MPQDRVRPGGRPTGRAAPRNHRGPPRPQGWWQRRPRRHGPGPRFDQVEPLSVGTPVPFSHWGMAGSLSGQAQWTASSLPSQLSCSPSSSGGGQSPDKPQAQTGRTGRVEAHATRRPKPSGPPVATWPCQPPTARAAGGPPRLTSPLGSWDFGCVVDGPVDVTSGAAPQGLAPRSPRPWQPAIGGGPFPGSQARKEWDRASPRHWGERPDDRMGVSRKRSGQDPAAPHRQRTTPSLHRGPAPSSRRERQGSRRRWAARMPSTSGNRPPPPRPHCTPLEGSPTLPGVGLSRPTRAAVSRERATEPGVNDGQRGDRGWPVFPAEPQNLRRQSPPGGGIGGEFTRAGDPSHRGPTPTQIAGQTG